MKTSAVIEVYKALKEAKLTKMESKEKFQVIKIMRSIKPVAEEWDAFMATVDEKLKGENHEAIVAMIQQWQREGDNTTLTMEERKKINEYIAKFNTERNELINAELAKEVEVSFERFVDSNDMDVNVLTMLSENICG